MKSYTDIEQSKKLAKILLLESSDHHYVRKVCDFRGNSVDGEWSCPKYGNINSKYANYMVQNFTSYEIIPCWSLTALLGVLPKSLIYTPNPTLDGYCCKNIMHDLETYADNPIDACYEMILELNELKLL